MANYLITDSYDNISTNPNLNLGGQTAISYPAKLYSDAGEDALRNACSGHDGLWYCRPVDDLRYICLARASSNQFETWQYSSNQLTAQCPQGSTTGAVSLDLNAVASPSTTPLSYYYGQGVNGSDITWLQPVTWNPDYVGGLFDPTNFNGDFGYAQMKCGYSLVVTLDGWADWPNPKSQELMLNQNFSWGSDSAGTTGYWYAGNCADHATDVGWMIFDYNSPQGLHYYFWLGTQNQAAWIRTHIYRCNAVALILIRTSVNKSVKIHIPAYTSGISFAGGPVVSLTGPYHTHITTLSHN